jgi:hypothetical protein
VEGECVRIIVVGGRGKLLIDWQAPPDQVFKHNGRSVLAVDPATAGYLAEAMVDFSRGCFRFVENGEPWGVLETRIPRLGDAAG